MINSAIKGFLKEAKSINNDVYINLQGYPYFFKLINFETLEFEAIKRNSKISNSLFIWEYTDFEERGFDIQSGFPLLRPIVDGVEIATDKTGKLFEIKYFPRDSNKKHSIKPICSSIDKLLHGLKLQDCSKDENNNIILHIINELSNVLNNKQIDLIHKFSDVKYTINDYIQALNVVVGKSDKGVEISLLATPESKNYLISIKHNDTSFSVKFQPQNGEYIAHLIDNINDELVKRNEPIRFALINENSWKELYGLAIVDKGVYGKLEKSNLLKHV